MEIKITKALIIDEPWISKILNGEKNWEMRSTHSKIRGPIGLIRKGSLQVVGVAYFSNVSGPYDNAALISHTEYHCIPAERFDLPDYKWRYAWELTEVIPLKQAVLYQHKNGAVIWVELNTEAVDEITKQLNAELALTPQVYTPIEKTEVIQTEPSQPSVLPTHTFELKIVHDAEGQFVPKAKDGSVFSVDTSNSKGIYTVGNKGDEQKFPNFYDALDYLKSMPTARWRRKNVNGTPGIVTAVEWVELEKS